ncbi:unnamed protein product [Thelazia callipaeda]|uniref:Uncharacterized protein n=1 Tax=Thelazia callipaeda TaxID=103827 RepID=A0A0N5D4M2_THECL|nr:unnamed protein product [Thelazia callipaeda]
MSYCRLQYLRPQSLLLLALVLVLILNLTDAQLVYLDSKGMNKVDTDQIIYPLLKPLAKAVDIMEQNAQALKLVDNIERESQESLINPSRSMFDLLKPREKLDPSSTPKPMLQRLLEGLMQSLALDQLTTSSSMNKDPFANFFELSKTAPQITATTSSSWVADQQSELMNSLSLKSKVVNKRQINLFDQPPLELDNLKPIELANPFTPNPLMSLFTNPIIDKYTTILPKLPRFKSAGDKLPKIRFPEVVHLPNPFANPFVVKKLNSTLH